MAAGYIDGTDKAIIGVDNFHYAVQLLDRPDVAIYGDIMKFPNIINATATPSAVEATLYADNKAVIQYTGVGNVAVSLEFASIPTQVVADLVGSPRTGAVKHTSGDQTAPYVGIAWRQLYNTGEYSYVKLYKGQFQEPEVAAQTKGDSIEFQTRTLTGTFVSTAFEGEMEGKTFSYLMDTVDEADPLYADEGETWFNKFLEGEAPAWATGTRYVVGAIVSNTGKTYRCVKSHNASATFSADEANWAELSF